MGKKADQIIASITALRDAYAEHRSDVADWAGGMEKWYEAGMIVPPPDPREYREHRYASANLIINEEGGSRANLSRANLSWACLSGANISEANFRNVGGREVNTLLSVTGIGREGRQTLWWVEEDIIWCGCFKGTMAELEAKVESQHGDSGHGQNYRDAITWMKAVAGRRGTATYQQKEADH